MDLAENVREWVVVDNQIRQLSDQLRSLREKRSAAQDDVMRAASEAGASGARIKVSDGYLKLTQVRTTAPLSLRYIESCLSATLGDAARVTEIMGVIKSGRTVKEEPSIKRTLHQSDD